MATAAGDAGEIADPDLADRTIRAATERMAVALDAPGVWTVNAEPRTVDGVLECPSYRVSLVGSEWVCECGDYRHREPTGGCKHSRRVQLLIGDRPIPDRDDLDPLLERRRTDID